MAERDVLDFWIAAAGQSQAERTPAELDAHHFEVDERTPADLLRYQQALAKLLLFFGSDPAAAEGDWSPFFPPGALDASAAARPAGGRRTPHLALCETFAHLHELPRELVNRFTGRHLDFFYQRVLGFRPRPPQPDHAHVLVELKKGVAPVLIEPSLELSAGKDARGVERIYRPLLATPIGGAKVESLRALHTDADGRVRRADVADSADGQGAKLPAGGSWPAFGPAGFPLASLGFAVASPLLRLRGGRRQIRLKLSLGGLGKKQSAAFGAAFEAYLTGDKGWIGPLLPSPEPGRDAGALAAALLQVALPAELPPVVDFRPAQHGPGLELGEAAPLLRLVLKNDGPLRPADLRGVFLRQLELEVEVAELGGFQAENDQGRLDVGKAFLPFGPQPVAGSRLVLRDPEIFAKPLSRLTLDLGWQNPPADFADWYQGYAGTAPANAAFTVAIAAVDGLRRKSEIAARRLFGAETRHQTLSLPLAAAGAGASPGAGGEPGYLALVLERDFQHAVYRQQSLAKILEFAKAAPTHPPTPPALLNEPYTPTLQALTLGYRAAARLALDSASAGDSLDRPDGLRFFHLLPFGSRREHGALRAGLPHAEPRVPLLPFPPPGGELLIGLSGLFPGESVSLLVQVAEGSGDPEVPRPPLSFSVLAGDHWRPLAPAEVYRDSTRQLLRSGLMGLICPSEATTGHFAMPAGSTWYRIAAEGELRGFCRLVAVAAGGVEVIFDDRGNDPAHTTAALPAGTIDKAKRGAPAGLKAVSQPYASFGFAPAENATALHTRAAERLRHRGRASTAWDFERLVLGEFPGVHRVKCIAHSDGEDFFVPGAVLLVVLPDLRNQNAVDTLRPRVDTDTLAAIADFLRPRCAAGLRLTVRNPRYQEVQLDFGVRFRPGLEFNLHRDRLERSLIEFLAPWAFDADRPLTFGGRLYRSVLLQRVEETASVDYVRDFRLFAADDAGGRREQADLAPQRPDAILVPAARHHLWEVKA